MGIEGIPLQVCGVSTVEIKLAGEIFHCPILIACSLTSDAKLRLDFLEANYCTLEMADRKLTLPKRGVSVSFAVHHLILTSRVTVDETLTIPLFSVLEMVARVNGKVRG